MNSWFVPYGEYEDIINLLGQWKILSMQDLTKMLRRKIKYSTLAKKISKLEREGIIKSVNIGRNKKHMYLSDEGLQFTPFDSSSEITRENLVHDLTVANVLKTFLSLDGFKDGKMFHQIVGEDIYPDALLYEQRDGEQSCLAIEVELTQKEQSRVKGKFVKYAKSSVYDYVVFITNGPTLYQTYMRYLIQMSEKVQRTIILMHDVELNTHQQNFIQARCWYLGEELKFNEVFGVKA